MSLADDLLRLAEWVDEASLYRSVQIHRWNGSVANVHAYGGAFGSDVHAEGSTVAEAVASAVAQLDKKDAS